MKAIKVMVTFLTSTSVCGDQRVTWGHLKLRRMRFKQFINRLWLLTGYLGIA